MIQRIMAVTEVASELNIVEAPIPSPQGDEVLIKTTFGGLCHSDLHQIDGYFDLGGGRGHDI